MRGGPGLLLQTRGWVKGQPIVAGAEAGYFVPAPAILYSGRRIVGLSVFITPRMSSDGLRPDVIIFGSGKSCRESVVSSGMCEKSVSLKCPGGIASPYCPGKNMGVKCIYLPTV